MLEAWRKLVKEAWDMYELFGCHEQRTGKPSLDPDHPDFVPTVFAHKAPVKRSSVARYARATKRKIGDRTNEALPLVVPCIHEDPQSVDPGGSAETGNEDQSPLAPGTCPGDAHCDTPSGEGTCDEVPQSADPAGSAETGNEDQSPLVPGTCPGDAHCDTLSGEGACDEVFSCLPQHPSSTSAHINTDKPPCTCAMLHLR
ncbi:hypothetical protein ISCGN_011947 [Ixodes scapularis]